MQAKAAAREHGQFSTPWRELPHLPLKRAAEIAGLSPATLYHANSKGELVFVRLGGRTLVQTESLKAYIATAEKWTPSHKVAKANEARKAAAAKAWEA